MNNEQLEVIRMAFRGTLYAYINASDIDDSDYISFDLGSVRCPINVSDWRAYADDEKNKLIEEMVNDAIENLSF